jgi:hypothetical protein
MNLVVNFLSMLNGEEEHSAVKRMLGICTEFERIGKVVLDRADKETNPKRKRRNQSTEIPKAAVPTQSPASVARASQGARTVSGTLQPNDVPFPASTGVDLNFGASLDAFASASNNADISWMPEFASTNMPNMPAQPNGLGNNFPDMAQQSFNPNIEVPFGMGAFPPNGQQPFVPPDLWQMLEWDWAGLTTTVPNNLALSNGLGVGTGMDFPLDGHVPPNP